MLTPEQRELRRRGLGSSDMPRVVGVSPHGGPIDVYLDKLGLAEDGAGAEAWVGDRAEAFIASLYEERLADDAGAQPALRVQRPRPGQDWWDDGDEGETIAHPQHTWALATPDRFRGDEGALSIVEIKLVGSGMLHLWRPGVQLADGCWTGLPVHVEVQVQWQLEVCDVDRADVAALLGGTDFRIYHVARDRGLGADLLALAEDFWINHVLAREPPPMSGEDARRLAQLRYPMSTTGDILDATPEAEDLRDRILRVKRHQRRVEDLRAHLEARAMDLVGSSDGIKDCFTWKRGSSAKTWKAAARESFLAGARASTEEMWSKLEQWAGDDEAVWQALAMRGGADQALVKDTGAQRRRFLTKEPRNGGRR